MTGPEVSVLRLSDVLADNRDKRLDSQYFRRAALAAVAQLARHSPEPISKIASDVRSFGAYALTNEFEYEEAGIPFLRGTNYSGDFINFTDVLRISPEAHALLYKSAVEPGMVLLSMSGSVGSVAVALDSWEYPINSNQDIAKIVPSAISPFYLAGFLGSAYGQAQINRLPVGSVQQHVFLWMIERLLVPRFGLGLESRIGALIERAYLEHEAVHRAVQEAESGLMRVLGLGNCSPSEPLTYSTTAAAVRAAGRLDAQYFMPAKWAMQQALARLPGERLSEKVESIRDQWAPERADPHQRVRNYDVTDALVPLLDIEKAPVTAAEVGSMKKIFQDGDVVISRLRAYLKEVAVVQASHDSVMSVGSSEFIVLRPRKSDLSPETLMAFLRSTPVQVILKWCQDGSQHPRFSEGDLLAIPVPDAVCQASPLITKIVQQGFLARQRARRLMALARRAVEIAIEYDAARGMAFLDTQQESD